jgi:1,2-diacylglycerol 3-alpha-glucosyltransferase
MRMETGALNDVPLQFRSVAMFTEVYAPIINGVVASIDSLRDGLTERGFASTLVAPYFPHASADDATIVRVPSLPLPTSTGYRLCIPVLPRAARERIAHATVVHAHSPFVTGRLATNIARRRGLPLVFTYHTRIDAYAHYAPFAPSLARRAMLALTRAFANRTDTVIAPTAAMRERLREIGVRVPIAVVPSAIDVARFAGATRSDAARALLGARDGAPLVIAVARIAKEKHLELAIDALAHAPRVRLAIVGDGPHRVTLEARAAQTGVRDRVTFTGAVLPAVLPALYAASDAFVFPSETETQGLVLAEALVAGLPVVAVDTPVNREMLEGAGRLVPPDAPALAAAIEAALGAPRDLAATAAARLRFGRERQSAAMLDVYQSISVCRTFGTPVRDHAPG